MNFKTATDIISEVIGNIDDETAVKVLSAALSYKMTKMGLPCISVKLGNTGINLECELVGTIDSEV